MWVTFYAGAITAWTTVYVASALYAWWAARRPNRDAGIDKLALFFAALGVSALTDAAAVLMPSPWLVRVSDLATLPCPLLLRAFIDAQNPKEQLKPKVRALLVGVTLIAAVLSLTGFLELPRAVDSQLFPRHTTLGAVVAAMMAGLVLWVTATLGRVRGRQLGLLPFVGGLLLSVSAVYDAVTAVAGVPHLNVIQAGYAAFTMTLLADQIVRFVLRRERLLTKTAELSERSQTLSRSFKDLRTKQDDLVKKQQLAAIGELSAVVAHEVRNPLAVISNAVATLRRPNVSDEHRETLLEILSEEAARLNQLVGDLLRYARPLSLEPESVNLQEVVEKAVKTLADAPNVTVSVEVEAGVPAVGGDKLLIRQAVDNVVHNAAQAMGGGGTLTIELQRESEGRGARMLFKDTGEGMDTVVRKRALDPFFTTRSTGTGLGLAIVARVVEAHGGQLTIKSERGAGTEVEIFLPVHPGQGDPKSSRRPPIDSRSDAIRAVLDSDAQLKKEEAS